jgi:hypothetical protein
MENFSEKVMATVRISKAGREFLDSKKPAK